MLLSAIGSNPIYVIISIFASLFLVLCVIPLHEYAHAFAAYKMGDNTAKIQGRLKLNPLVHIDPLGSLMILLTGFGWGRPCPIDSRNFKNEKKGIIITSLAGPLSNLILGGILIFLATLFSNLSGIANTILGYILYNFCYISAEISIYLAVLNLLPIPPLDGFRVLSVFLSDRAYYTIMANQQMISIIVIVLLLTRVLTIPLSLLAGLFIKFFSILSALPFA